MCSTVVVFDVVWSVGSAGNMWVSAHAHICVEGVIEKEREKVDGSEPVSARP